VVDAGLDFPDLTGYNVMVAGEEMWLVDFEHAGENETRLAQELGQHQPSPAVPPPQACTGQPSSFGPA
jgi:hypothetical protein